MKASALSGDKHSVTAEYMIRLLALEECADTIGALIRTENAKCCTTAPACLADMHKRAQLVEIS